MEEENRSSSFFDAAEPSPGHIITQDRKIVARGKEVAVIVRILMEGLHEDAGRYLRAGHLFRPPKILLVLPGGNPYKENMIFDLRSKAKRYTLKDGDTLEKIAQQESTPGKTLTASILARYNWGTDDPDVINEYLRDELGCYKRGSDKRFIMSSDAKPRMDLLIPQPYRQTGLATRKTHTIRVKVIKPPPKQFSACMRVGGVCFEFDKSFIRPAVVDDLQTLNELSKKYPDSKIVIFGHTDKVGKEKYNKDLSERRALSTYAFITNDTDTWEKLYNDENWGIRAVQAILKDIGGEFDPGPVDGIEGPKTKTAIKNYQKARGLTVDGIAGPKTRKQLFTEYMSSKHDIKLDAGRFMDPKLMGCGEFNPVVETEDPCEPNRRVTFFFFHKDRLPNLPCKLGDLAPCKKQISQPLPRYKDSFHCSFFDSLAKNCPLESEQPVVVKNSWIEIYLHDEKGNPVPNEPFILVLSDKSEINDTLDKDGRVRIEGIEAGQCKVSFPNLEDDQWSKD